MKPVRFERSVNSRTGPEPTRTPAVPLFVYIRKAPILDSRLRGNDEPEPVRGGAVHNEKLFLDENYLADPIAIQALPMALTRFLKLSTRCTLFLQPPFSGFRLFPMGDVIFLLKLCCGSQCIGWVQQSGPLGRLACSLLAESAVRLGFLLASEARGGGCTMSSWPVVNNRLPISDPVGRCFSGQQRAGFPFDLLACI
jgi:hypothetical protein